MKILIHIRSFTEKLKLIAFFILVNLEIFSIRDEILKSRDFFFNREIQNLEMVNAITRQTYFFYGEIYNP